MHGSFLNRIRSESVGRVEVVHDYLQIEFNNGAKLSIYNRWKVENEARLAVLEGASLDRVEVREGSIYFAFSTARLIVDINSDAYPGPEALTLWVDGQVFVWNGD